MQTFHWQNYEKKTRMREWDYRWDTKLKALICNPCVKCRVPAPAGPARRLAHGVFWLRNAQARAQLSKKTHPKQHGSHWTQVDTKNEVAPFQSQACSATVYAAELLKIRDFETGLVHPHKRKIPRPRPKVRILDAP